MPSLTDGAIRHAIKRVETSGKQETLTDGQGRGTERLILVLRAMPKRVLDELRAQQWRDGKRTKAKLGSYPSLSCLNVTHAQQAFRPGLAGLNEDEITRAVALLKRSCPA